MKRTQEWDEIQDVGSGDEKKISVVDGDTTNRAEPRKLASADVDVKDLSWDIEDDDEPAKVDCKTLYFVNSRNSCGVWKQKKKKKHATHGRFHGLIFLVM